jgi:hypothetical protein
MALNTAAALGALTVEGEGCFIGPDLLSQERNRDRGYRSHGRVLGESL